MWFHYATHMSLLTQAPVFMMTEQAIAIISLSILHEVISLSSLFFMK